MVGGEQAIVCSNLAFFGSSIRIARKHTRLILQDLPALIDDGVQRLIQEFHHQNGRVSAYKEKHISDRSAHDLVIRGMDAGVCSNRMIPQILEEWRNPRHPEFEGRNTWALFNAFTESLKTTTLSELPRRTSALHRLFDGFVGLN